jgi:hypothetical protein
MFVIKSVESGVLSAKLREALWTLLSQHNLPYLNIISSNSLGVCISTYLADFCRHIKAEVQKKIDSWPKVLANYTVNSRQKLLNRIPKYQDTAVQTEFIIKTAIYKATHARPRTLTNTAQTKSALKARRL